MITFKNLITERKFSDDLDELLKNLDIIAVLGKGISKLSTDINSQPYEIIGDIEVKKIEKIKEILKGFEKTINDTNKILNKDGSNGKEGNSEDSSEGTGTEETDRGRDIKFTNPGQKLPANI